MVNKESEIEAMTKIQFNTIVRNKIRENTLKILKEKQEGHIKIRHINYSTLNTQSYLKTHMLNNHEASLLFSLRSETTREFTANFPYNVNQLCVMGCQVPDTPQHCMSCRQLKLGEAHDKTHEENLAYEHLFSDVLSQQVAVTKMFSTLLERREDASSLTGPSHSPIQGHDSN